MASTAKKASRSVRDLTDAELDAQLQAGSEREEAERAAGLRATSARYDAKTERVILELSSGMMLGFRADIVRGLENATPAQRAKLELSPSGDGVLWEELDADISVPGLITKLFTSAAARATGRAGGKSKSDAKAKAAKANGAKGGRPRKIVSP